MLRFYGNNLCLQRRNKKLTTEKRPIRIHPGSFDFIKGIGIISVILIHSVAFSGYENS